MSVSGGMGQFYEIAYSLIARLRGMQLFLHHHTFAYLDDPNRRAAALVASAGGAATHIALSVGMAAKLRGFYSVTQVVPISNTALIPISNFVYPARRRLNTIGFLSNIAAEKGVFDFLDLAEALQRAGLGIKVMLAGPFQDVSTERKVLTRLTTLPNVKYVGSKYGSEKDQFFQEVDVLIFPTRYKNEAEPLIVHEAMRAATPVIAYGRGAIPEIVGDGGCVVEVTRPFVPAALDEIKMWMEDPNRFELASQAALAKFVETRAVNEQKWLQLRDRLILGNQGGTS